MTLPRIRRLLSVKKLISDVRDPASPMFAWMTPEDRAAFSDARRPRGGELADDVLNRKTISEQLNLLNKWINSRRSMSMEKQMLTRFLNEINNANNPNYAWMTPEDRATFNLARRPMLGEISDDSLSHHKPLECMEIITRWLNNLKRNSSEQYELRRLIKDIRDPDSPNYIWMFEEDRTAFREARMPGVGYLSDKTIASKDVRDQIGMIQGWVTERKSFAEEIVGYEYDNRSNDDENVYIYDGPIRDLDDDDLYWMTDEDRFALNEITDPDNENCLLKHAQTQEEKAVIINQWLLERMAYREAENDLEFFLREVFDPQSTEYNWLTTLDRAKLNSLIDNLKIAVHNPTEQKVIIMGWLSANRFRK